MVKDRVDEVCRYVKENEPVEPHEMIEELAPGTYCPHCGTVQDKQTEGKYQKAIRRAMQGGYVHFSLDWKLVMAR